jgi:quaternary ammonium compound-resistance protein SugE
MDWLALSIAGLLEIVWAVGLRLSQGLARPGIAAVTLLSMLASFGLLAYALRTLPVGTGYAVWTGIGAAGTALAGMLFLGESRDPLRVVCVLVIVAGIVGLKLTTRG